MDSCRNHRLDSSVKYKKILLKLSGEALMGSMNFGIDPKIVLYIAREIKSLYELGIKIAVVIGGGNIFRGLKASSEGMDRVTGDYMGMLATAINSLALQDSLEKLGLITRVQNAIEITSIAEPYIRRRAIRHLDKGRVVIFAGGTGNPFFSTDTAAALRALEISAEIIIKATKVDGIYDKDPKLYSDAKKIDRISYQEVLNKQLGVMDATAITLCRENKLPIFVYNLHQKGELIKIAKGEKVGSYICE